jgi:multiple sugar transport system ATP-binding protein
MIEVRLQSIRKSYGRGDTPVLGGIDLTIEKGELLTFVGPSGCGKSTLLNLIAGFDRPTEGHVLIDGRVVDDLSPRDRDVAMVFQSYALYPHLDVRQNIAFPLEAARTPRGEIKTRVAATAERLGLSQLLDRKPRELSGGQRQRVALARALVRKPKLCLFDEPLSNLDATLRGLMRAEIKKLHEELGATFVYVTHDQAEAMTLSDRVVVLNAGAIEQAAPPRDVYDHPATRFVASFMGSPPINFLPDALGASLAAAPEGGVIGVRPEDVRVTADEAPGAARAKVWVVEPTGPETWVTLELEGSRLVGRAAASFATRPGGEAFFAIDRDRIHVFDDKTGKRVVPSS